MEKEKLYHIALDDYEHGVVIRSLNDEKTKLMEEGKSADAVDDLLVKVGNALLLYIMTTEPREVKVAVISM